MPRFRGSSRIGAPIVGVACLAASLLSGGASAQTADAIEYSWEEAYFPSGDGTLLHADILRHPEAPKDAKQPVILTVSPYLNHSGQTIDGFDPFGRGPSTRFFDFLELGKVLERGYTYVMVDLRGFGGSAGCTDWGGPGEQADVKAAVEWAGQQSWSNGRVGMFGKSYDGWTGLMAIANRPKHLAAVVSMEPVYDGYRYLYTEGIRYANAFATPAVFVADDVQPGSLNDTPEYHLNGSGPNAACYGLFYAEQQNDDGESAFWQARELIAMARGATTPLLLTQGFLETNTKPDGAFAFFNGMAGPKRAWFGQFDHVRGYEKQDDELAVGREGFLEETIRFFDRHLKGHTVEDDPSVVVQAVDGRYRAEAEWPPADVMNLSTVLRPGTYLDDSMNYGGSPGADDSRRLWSISKPLPYAVHLAGEPVLEATVTTTLPRANLVANVYDVDQRNKALLVSRGAWLVREAGTSRIRMPMFGQDWPIPAGHRIGVVLSGANSEWWVHIPTMTDVEVTSASMTLPFLRYARSSFLEGKAGPRLRGFREGETFSVAGDPLGPAISFTLPPPLVAKAAVKPSTASPKSKPKTPGKSLPATGVPSQPLATAGTALVVLALAGWGYALRSRRVS